MHEQNAGCPYKGLKLLTFLFYLTNYLMRILIVFSCTCDIHTKVFALDNQSLDSID